jgi:hypothetical protein
VSNKFVVTYVAENMIIGVRDKGKENSKIILDFLIKLLDLKDFRNIFMFLEGHLMLVK